MLLATGTTPELTFVVSGYTNYELIPNVILNR